MRILVSYNEVFDSDQFYEDLSVEERSKITSEQFIESIFDFLEDEPIIGDCKFVILEDDDSDL